MTFHKVLAYRPDIDALRAVAVLLVLVFHAYPEVLPAGFIGVDVFFVISGYLVTSIILEPLAKGTFSIVTFYVRRIRRIFPALIIVTSASLVLGWVELLPPELKSLGRHVSAAAVFLSNFLLGTETGYFDAPAHSKPLLHLWSLGIEEQFYIIWPVLLFFFAKLRFSGMWLVAALAPASFAHGIFLLNKGSTWAFYSPTARFWELMIGAAVAIVQVRQRTTALAGTPITPDATGSFPISCSPTMNSSSVVKHILSVVGAAVLIAGIVLIRQDSSFPGYMALYPTLGTASLLAAGPGAIVNRTFLSFRPLIGIGLISYPLYLWHWPLLSISYIAYFGEVSQTIRALILGISFLLAWLTYTLVEKSMRGGGFGRTKAIVLVLMLGVVGVCGHYTFRHDGFINLRSSLVRSFYFYELERGAAWRSEVCFHEESEAEKAPDFEKCTNHSPLAEASRVFLWGDSHAASFYPSLKSVAGDAITLTQVTTAICPPLLHQPGARKGCNERNQSTLEKILQDKPDVVILAGNWRGDVPAAVASILKKLKDGGIKTVILVGRTPIWRKPAPHVIAASIQADPFSRIPHRYKSAVEPDDAVIKAQLMRAAKDHDVVFVSPYDALCNDRGCLALTGNTPDTIVTGDLFHLTKWGGILVMSHFPKFWCPRNGQQGSPPNSNLNFCGNEVLSLPSDTAE